MTLQREKVKQTGEKIPKKRLFQCKNKKIKICVLTGSYPVIIKSDQKTNLKERLNWYSAIQENNLEFTYYIVIN